MLLSLLPLICQVFTYYDDECCCLQQSLVIWHLRRISRIQFDLNHTHCRTTIHKTIHSWKSEMMNMSGRIRAPPCCCSCLCWCIVTCVRGHPGTPRCNQDSRDYIMLPSKPPITITLWSYGGNTTHLTYFHVLFSFPMVCCPSFFYSTSPCVITWRLTIYESEYNITDLSLELVREGFVEQAGKLE